jgi:hypothetical protein
MRRHQGDDLYPHSLESPSVLPPPTFAHWENVENPNNPRTADGKPNLAAPTPRAPDGKPDLSENDIQSLGDRS